MMCVLVPVQITVGNHTRIRVYDAVDEFICKGDLVVVPTRNAGPLVGTAVSDSVLVDDDAKQLIRSVIHEERDFLPVLHSFRLPDPEPATEADPEKEVV